MSIKKTILRFIMNYMIEKKNTANVINLKHLNYRDTIYQLLALNLFDLFTRIKWHYNIFRLLTSITCAVLCPMSSLEFILLYVLERDITTLKKTSTTGRIKDSLISLIVYKNLIMLHPREK